MKTTQSPIRILLLALLCICVSFALPVRAAEAENALTLEQAERAYYARCAEMVAQHGPRDTWTLEQKAALDQLMLDAGYWDVHSAVPAPNEVVLEEALRIAREAILQDGKASPEMLESFSVDINFWAFTDESAQPLWDFRFHSPTVFAEQYGSYGIHIGARSGLIAECRWEPEAPPAVYSPEELLPSFDTAAPFPITYEQAQAIAKETVLARFGEEHGLTESMMAGFIAVTWDALLEEDGRTYWQIEVRSMDGHLHQWMGGFDVIIDTETGEVKDARQGQNG